MARSKKMAASQDNDDASFTSSPEETKQAGALAATLIGLAVLGAYVGLSLKLGGGVAIVVGIMLVCGGTFLGVLRGPVGRAWARRIDSDSSGASLEEIDALHARVDELEAGQQRLADLEERLDFAERLLTRGNPESQLADRKG